MVNICDKCGTVEGCLLMIFTYDEFLMNMTVIRSHIFNHFSKSRTIFLYISSFSSQLLLVNSRVLCLLAFGFNPWNQMSTAGQKNGWFLIHICGGFLCLCAKSLQLWPALGAPMDCSPPYSSVPGIFWARILEWVSMLSSRDRTLVSSISCTGGPVLYG